MYTPKTIRLTGLLLLLLVAFSGTAFRSKPTPPLCFPIVLLSPPANFYVSTPPCTSTAVCNRSSTTTLTLNGAGPCAHTWTFTNTTTGCVKVFNTAAGVASLQVSIPGSTGDVIQLVITDTGGGSSALYTFNAVSC